jgi:hypothetical protein
MTPREQAHAMVAAALGRERKRAHRAAIEKKSHAAYRLRHRARILAEQKTKRESQHWKQELARRRWEESRAWLSMRVVNRSLLDGALAEAQLEVVKLAELDNPCWKFQLRGRTTIESLRQPLPT